MQVFLEVLRLYPPGIGTSRESPADDFCLSGYPIPKGTNIMLNFYANHRNPEHWDDPETFDPNRFSPARGKWASLLIIIIIVVQSMVFFNEWCCTIIIFLSYST